MKTMIQAWTSAILALVIFVAPASAATILTGQSVRINTPVEGNVYAGAGEITINAIVNGDVTAGTGELWVTDTIRHDLIVGGGRIHITGVIGEDLRCGGGEVELRGDVLGDVVVGCGDLEIGPDVVIHGDLVIGGGQVRMYGKVLGSVILAGGEVKFYGEAAQDADIRGGDVLLDGTFRGPCKFAAKNLELGSKAAFFQEVRYWHSAGEIDFGDHLREGAVATYDTSLKQDIGEYRKNWFERAFSMFFLYRLLAGALLVTLFILLLDPFFQRTKEGLPQQWLNRMGMGVLYLIGLPVAMILLFITVIGIPIGLFALFFYLFTLLFAYSLTATVGAYAWEQYRGLSWTKGQRILAGIGILIGLKLITWVPAVGFLVIAVAIAVAFGSMIKALGPDSVRTE